MRTKESLDELKGIGEKTAKLFEKLGVTSVEDLLAYYPRAYDSCKEPVPLGAVKENTVCAIRSALVKYADLLRFNRMQMVSVSLKDETGSLQLVWYNMPYMRTNLKPGQTYVFRGMVAKKRGRLVMEQPEVFSPEEYKNLTRAMQPIYGQTKDLGNKAITKAVAQALERRSLKQEYLPDAIRARNHLAEINFAEEHIHFPADEQELLEARSRLVFDELFFFLIGVRRMKEQRANVSSAYVIADAPLAKKLSQTLPFQLTGAQQRVLGEVQRDLASGVVMNRLIQGDVGSGKTIVAVLSLLAVAEAGFQGAMMAPTEVLARQHYESITKLFAEHKIQKQVVLLTGSMTAKEKRLAYQKIESHEADLIVGTHALIQEKVRYDKLALVITDEQHRFGVGQREMLGTKGENPHVLVMSATPIPRTLAIILYGDLDISVMDELPAGRSPIKNCVVDTNWRPKAYAFIADQVAQGRQAYVICPMVEASEMIEAENVIDYAKRLKSELPTGICVEYLHGKMKGKEKNAIMERFALGEIQVLVSTTVIEVGVNVPNATVMMIENAERFGLAQLHQLRGRVGRGKFQSYCMMINAGGEGAMKRLDILNRSNDGFYIASEDLKLRGPGDLFGIRQSGELEFQLADIFTDAPLLKAASEEVKRLLEEDPLLTKPEHEALKSCLDTYLGERYEKLLL